MHGRVLMLMMATGLAVTARAADAPHDWVGVGVNQNNDAMTFVDAPAITRRADGIVMLRQAMVPLNPPDGMTAAITATVEADCDKRQMRRVDIQGWRIDGTLIAGGKIDGKWEVANPGSVGAAILDFACAPPENRKPERFPRSSDPVPTATARGIMTKSAT